jgi:hypothetical protein
VRGRRGEDTPRARGGGPNVDGGDVTADNTQLTREEKGRSASVTGGASPDGRDTRTGAVVCPSPTGGTERMASGDPHRGNWGPSGSGLGGIGRSPLSWEGSIGSGCPNTCRLARGTRVRTSREERRRLCSAGTMSALAVHAHKGREPGTLARRCRPFAQLRNRRYHATLCMGSGIQQKNFRRPPFRRRVRDVQRKQLVAVARPDQTDGNPRPTRPHRGCPGLVEPSFTRSGQR